MSLSLQSHVLTCLFLSVFFFNGYATEDLQTSITWQNLSQDVQNEEMIDEFLLEDSISRNRSRMSYDIYSSTEKQFAFFRVFKVASGTLTHFFNDQVPDLISSRPNEIPKEFKNYFKFAFVRNPWDRIVSCYFHKVMTEDDLAFQECFGKDFDYFVDYINQLDLITANRHIRLQTRLIPVKSCDFIGKADNLVNDLQYVCNVLGLEMAEISHRHKTDHAHYSTYYNPRTKKIIAKKYKEDIETFGFTFETE